MTPTFAPASADAIPLTALAPDALDGWLAEAPDTQAAWVRASGFTATPGSRIVLPAPDGGIAGVLAGLGDAAARARSRFPLADLANSLPEGTYALGGVEDAALAREIALGWLLSSYRFTRYKQAKPAPARLVAPDGVNAAETEAIAAAAMLSFDLINTPANQMTPAALEDAVTSLASEFGATCAVTSGDALLTENFPMIHAVGRASDVEPRLLDLQWGPEDAPKVTLVGKGVCFDTGGLNLKPGGSMALMKKDMGGAANAIGLARMIMALRLNLRLRLLVPAVENSVSAGAFRPGDVLMSRKGLTVEINNTDAEGRLVLADALALADEEAPAAIFCLATLTGAARVALGPDLMPFYTDDEGLADALGAASRAVADPLWRMPFWDPYEPMIEPDIADLDNAPKGGMAGSVTAALFLRRFVERAERFAHLDIYGWTPAAAPGRPRGGASQAARAILHHLDATYGRQ
ncbi:leucyl aminopeptidase family protein [Oceanomicrobium pacificus]|uniref:Leucyl aminopeptidase family protein n=1 Tax=Oceanomicrobium pacificus TaxID=2692916 RepID=A0A6B0TPL6_9RHOB|nr:leucyl aminopeptidase family protein [Oceanomicrobium pacificus]MXU64589.1 leucyl aminopeptidase family protein [Oceanomicrobium pacificus]